MSHVLPERVVMLGPRDAPVAAVTMNVDGHADGREIRRLYQHLGGLPSGIVERLQRLRCVLSVYREYRMLHVMKNPAYTWEEAEPRILALLSGRCRSAPPSPARITVRARARRSFPAGREYFVQPVLVPYRFTPGLGVEIRPEEGLVLKNDTPRIRRALERRLGPLVTGLRNIPGLIDATLGSHVLRVSVDSRLWRQVTKNFPKLRRKGAIPRWKDIDAAVLQLLAPFYGVPLAEIHIHRERAY